MYHKLNQSDRNERRDINLDEKVRKLHDLKEELKTSMRTKTVVSPETTKNQTQCSQIMLGYFPIFISRD